MCTRASIGTLVLMLAASPSLAHHSAAAKYDAAHSIHLSGRVAAFSWRNPHCFISIDVRSGDYKGRRYVVEMSSAVVLQAAGWSKTRLKPGDEVEITVMPSRTGSAAGLCRECEIRINGKVTKTS